MEKNKEYFAGAANIDTIVFKIVTDDNAKAMQLLSGELDLAQITPKEESLFADNDEFKVVENASVVRSCHIINFKFVIIIKK